MYSIRDAAVSVYHPPYFQANDYEALRSFATVANDSKTSIHQHPQDYDLYYIGEYDDNTGKMSPLDTPQHLKKASEMMQKTAENPA